MHLTLIVLFFLRKHVALLTLIGMDRLLQRAPLVTGISANASTHSGKPVSSGRDIIFFSQTSFGTWLYRSALPEGRVIIVEIELPGIFLSSVRLGEA